MISLKNPKEIQAMIQGGRILSGIISHLKKQTVAGRALFELEQEAEREILAAGGYPSFKMVPNYRFSTCLCVNEVIVHGLPSLYKLKKSDIIGIDVGFYYQGFHTDMAWTVLVDEEKAKEEADVSIRKFLEAGEMALVKAIKVAHEGSRVGDISLAIQEIIEKAGYSVVRSLVGHGIGRKLHEDPQVPGFLDAPKEKTPLLKKGMTLAIEVIYNMGGAKVAYRDDGWTIVAEDGSLSGLFEKTVAITKEEPIVLTP